MTRAPAPLKGRHVVITGASKGVGLALTRELIRRGCQVSAVARSEELLRAQAHELGSHPFVADLADPRSYLGLLDRIEAERGQVDVLVNNAAHPGAGALADVSPENLRAALEVNLMAPMELARQAASRMRQRGDGSIVNISSAAAGLALRNDSLYTVPKGGLTHLTDSMAVELRNTGVHVMLVVLGIIAGTELLQLASQDPVLAVTGQRFSMVPTRTPEQAARGIADGLEKGRERLVMPRLFAPFVFLRRTPSILADRLINTR